MDTTNKLAEYVLSRARGTSGRIILERHEEDEIRRLATPSADQATQPDEAVAWMTPTEFENLRIARECNDHRGFIVRPSREPDMIPSIPLFTHPAPASASEPMDMALCEIHSVMIRPGQLYTFSKVGDCEKCAAMDREAAEAYGPANDRPLARHMLASASVAGAGEALELPEPAWMSAFDEARDAILHDRGALEGEGMSNDQTNAILAILDDAFMPHLKRGPIVVADRIGAVALRLAKDKSYRHRAAEELLAICAALAARPVADGEVDKAANEAKIAFNALWAEITAPGRRGVPSGVNVHAAIDRLAALARQAPAPLSQAVPAGFWLAPMEPDEEMWTEGRDPIMYRDLGDYRPASMEVPAWQREPNGEVNHDKSKGTAAVRVWRAMRDSWLSRHPQPQAGTEDARDGERLDWLQNNEHSGLRIEYEGPHVGYSISTWDDTLLGGGNTIREAVDNAIADAVRRAQTSNGKGAE